MYKERKLLRRLSKPSKPSSRGGWHIAKETATFAKTQGPDKGFVQKCALVTFALFAKTHNVFLGDVGRLAQSLKFL